MLHRIPNTLTPDLLYILCKMGHGDELVIADANFPAESTSAFCQIKDPVYIPSLNAPKLGGRIIVELLRRCWYALSKFNELF